MKLLLIIMVYCQQVRLITSYFAWSFINHVYQNLLIHLLSKFAMARELLFDCSLIVCIFVLSGFETFCLIWLLSMLNIVLVSFNIIH